MSTGGVDAGREFSSLPKEVDLGARGACHTRGLGSLGDKGFPGADDVERDGVAEGVSTASKATTLLPNVLTSPMLLSRLTGLPSCFNIQGALFSPLLS